MNINEFQTRIDEPFDGDGVGQRRRPAENKCQKSVIVARSVISVLLALLLVASLGWTWLFSVVHGPSETYREEIVHRYMSKSSTKWLPYLVLPAGEIDSIMQNGEVLD
jgi:hypothetical protein